MTKRTLALFLALLMAGSAVSCGGTETPSGTDTTDGGGDTTVADTEEHSGVPADVDFKGETVTILNGSYTGFKEQQWAYQDVQESTGDIMNDAIYDRNLAVMENVGVKLEFDNMDIYKDYANVRTSIMAGDDVWDFIIGMQYRVTQLTPEGLFADIIDAPYIDIENPWWSTQFIENLNIGEKHRYLLCGDYSIGHLNQASAMFFNKKLYTDYYQNPDELYELVLDGKWTLDKHAELVSGVSKDLNGDTKIDCQNDIFGFGWMHGAFTIQHSVFCAGASFTAYEDGEYSLIGTSDTNVAIVEKLLNMATSNDGYALIQKPAEDKRDIGFYYADLFKENRILFVPDLLSFADILRDMESDYGVLPYPTLEEGGDYRALIHNQSMTMAVPVTNNDIDMACAVMEEMAFLGYRDMMPIYYETVLKDKYMRDNQDNAMKVIDIIHDNLYTELAFSFESYVPYWGTATREIPAGTNNFASTLAANKASADAKLATLIEFFK